MGYASYGRMVVFSQHDLSIVVMSIFGIKSYLLCAESIVIFSIKFGRSISRGYELPMLDSRVPKTYLLINNLKAFCYSFLSSLSNTVMCRGKFSPLLLLP